MACRRERATTPGGVAVGVLDAQIAAIAATRDHVLVTRNMRDFASYRELRVEMWWGNEPP